MTSSAELIAQGLGFGKDGEYRRRAVTFQSPNRSADRLALRAFEDEGDQVDEAGHMPGTRNELPNRAQIWGTAADLINQPQYRSSPREWAQSRRPVVPQNARPARGINVWGSAPGQLNGIAPEPRAA